MFDVVDQGMDVISRGAFMKSLEKRMPRLLWQHNMQEPIGAIDVAKEDDRGLFVKGRILKDIQKGAAAIPLIKHRILDSMSIGYRTTMAEPEAGGRVRRLIEVDLWEVSFVTMPMNMHAKITGIKDAEGNFSKRALEEALRDAGLSRAEAKAVTHGGFPELHALRDAGAAAEKEARRDENYAALMQEINKLKENIRG